MRQFVRQHVADEAPALLVHAYPKYAYPAAGPAVRGKPRKRRVAGRRRAKLLLVSVNVHLRLYRQRLAAGNERPHRQRHVILQRVHDPPRYLRVVMVDHEAAFLQPLPMPAFAARPERVRRPIVGGRPP